MHAACLARIFFILCVGCFGALLTGCKPKPPEHGYSFVIDVDLSDVPAAEHKATLAHAERALARRIDRIGIPAFPVAGDTNANRVILSIPRVASNMLAEVRTSVSKSCRVQFALVHPENDQLIRDGIKPPGYELKAQRHARAVQTFLVTKRPLPSPSSLNFKSAHVMRGSLNEPQIIFEFDEGGRQAFADVTTTNVSRQLAILIDGELYSAPIIREPILGGSATISGGAMTENEAAMLALMLGNSVPVPIRIHEEKMF
jgi:preprotein translocase subunit SecD